MTSNHQFSSGNPLRGGPINIQLKLNDTLPYSCSCGGDVFDNGVKLRRVSKILTAGGPELVVVPHIPYCVKCGKAVREAIPEELRDTVINVDSEIVPNK
jgi:hypothetical protein